MSVTATTFLDNPLLKVSRPVAACSRCRTAKIKCDGKLPACSACERVGKANTCSGASDEFAKGKERSYVASLEGYCEKLERKISQMRARSTSLSAHGDGVAREMSITSIASEGALGPAHHREVSDIDDLVGDFGFLSVFLPSQLVSLLTLPGRLMQLHETSTASPRIPPSPISSSQSLLSIPPSHPLKVHSPLDMKQLRYYNTISIIFLFSCHSLLKQVSGPRWMLSISPAVGSPNLSTTGYCAWYSPLPRHQFQVRTTIKTIKGHKPL